MFDTMAELVDGLSRVNHPTISSIFSIPKYKTLSPSHLSPPPFTVPALAYIVPMVSIMGYIALRTLRKANSPLYVIFAGEVQYLVHFS